MTWVRRRIIVDVPVQGDVTDRDLRWLVENALQSGQFEKRLRERHPGARTGRLDVKSFARVAAAEKRREAS